MCVFSILVNEKLLYIFKEEYYTKYLDENS